MILLLQYGVFRSRRSLPPEAGTCRRIRKLAGIERARKSGARGARFCRYLLLIVLWLAAAAPHADESLHSFGIPASNASEGLALFAEQSGIPLIYLNESVRDKHTNRVAGSYTFGRALEILLSGTGIAGSINERGVLTVTVAEADSHMGSKMIGPPESRNGKTSPFAAILAALAGIFAFDAGADQAVEAEAAPTRLGEILVTATKRRESLQDVPLSIAVVSNEDIERRGLIGMEDYLRAIPGVTEIDNGGPLNNSIIIRGISVAPEFGAANAASYFDEAPITGSNGGAAGGNSDIRPVDIERIEVLRGPQGTAYGAAALSGAVRMISVQPDLDEFSAKIAGFLSDTSGFGSDNSMIQGIVNIPVVEDKFALRAVGYRYDESGFYRNVAGIDPGTIATAESFGVVGLPDQAQEDIGRMRSTGGRFAALWQVTDKLNFSLNALTQEIEQDGSPAVTVGKYDQARFPVAPVGRLRGEAREVNDTEIDLLSLVLNYDLGWAELTSAASWVDSGAATTVSRFAEPWSQTGVSDVQSFTSETRLASQLEGRFQFLGGVFYETKKISAFFQGDWAGTPVTNPFGTDPVLFTQDSVDEVDQRALFGEVSFDLTEKLTATVGGRFFEYEPSRRVLSEGFFFGVPIGAGTPTVLRGSDSDSTFKVHVGYEPTNDSLLYASWAEGFRLGGPTAGLPSAVCDTDNDGVVDGTELPIEATRFIKSDFLENYEIGAKFTLLDRRMTVESAVYHIEWDGLPVFQLAPCSLSYFANAGAATSDGVEVQMSLSVANGLRLDFGAGYTKAELSRDSPGIGPDGARLPGSPEVSANLAAQYDFDLAGYRAFVRADSVYVGKYFNNLLETPGTDAGDYIKVDARAGVAIRELAVELFVRNLTNEDAFTWRSAFPTIGSYRLRPRTIGIQIGYRFE